MAQSFAIKQPQLQPQELRRPRSNALLNDNDNNDNEMKYDPSRKVPEREECHSSPLEKIDVGQDFTCTYVPTTLEEANDVNPMSPVSVTLNTKPQNHNHFAPQAQVEFGSWNQLVENGIILEDTGAPAALDPDDHPFLVDSQDQAKEGREQERKETWSRLVKVGAVLGEGGGNASELNVDMKVKLWGLTCAI